MMNELMISRADELNRVLEERNAGFRIVYQDSFKNNACKAGYALRSEENNCTPIVYYEAEWYEQDDEVVADYLEDMYRSHSMNFEGIDDLLDKDYVLANVLPRLVSEENIEEIERRGMVYEHILDMAVIYYVPIGEMPKGMLGFITVTNQMIANMDVSIESVHKASLENLEEVVSISDIADVIREMAGPDAIPECEPKMPMRVLSNASKNFGAAVMLLESVQQRLADEFGNYVILPSSVHECIAVPYKNASDLEQLIAMVKEVNATQVALEDKLTDNIYVVENGIMEQYL